jgi:hypothetical protein
MNKIKLLFITIVMTAAILAGCRSQTIYVPVETTRTDSIYINRQRVDTLMLRDSVFVEHKGDTTYLYKYKFLYKTKLSVDTIYIERIDSIQVPYPVEKSLSKWQQLKLDLSDFAFGGLLFVIVALVIYILIRTRNKK